MIAMILITGFLGSGKTTWLKQIARDHRDKRLIYLVNDFASVDVDGELVREAGEHVVAVSGGSIFCKCVVTQFIGVLKAIAAGQAGMAGLPQAVVVEASGMADPRVIHTMLRETGLDRTFKVTRIIAVADPATLPRLLRTLPNIKAQIQCADTVLISKSDLHPPHVIAATRQLVMQIQPTAHCALLTRGVTDVPLFAPGIQPEVDGAYALCRDPHYHHFALTESVPTLAQFQQRAERCSGHLYRAKGFVADGKGRVHAVDWSNGHFEARPWPEDPPPPLRVACIAAGAHGQEVQAIWQGVTARIPSALTILSS